MKKKKEYLENRELSWLKFNERVLEEAADKTLPLCERLSFVSIFQNNLDEFFMVRVGALQDQLLLKEKIKDSKTGMTSEEQIESILSVVNRLCEKRDSIYINIMKEVAEHGVKLVTFKDLNKQEKGEAEHFFDNEIAPLLSPMIVGRKHPFPFMHDREIYVVIVLNTEKGRQKIGIIPCGNNIFERFVEINGKYILIEDVILAFTEKIFKMYNVKAKSLIRITRNADIDADAMMDEDLNYRDMMESVVKMRKKLSPVRVELTDGLDKKILEMLCGTLNINKERIFISRVPLNINYAGNIRGLFKNKKIDVMPKLFFDTHTPKWPSCIDKDSSVLEQAERKDMLISYPYESVKPFLNMLHEAAYDEGVVSIKMTLYRLAKHSKIIETLIEAVENGKEVVVLVELKARFDEESNIEWSRRLEAAGCRVIYGLDGVKVHSKLCLITRKSKEGLRYITQIGTGNYNERTSEMYTDLSLITGNNEIGREAAEVFNAMSFGELPQPATHLLIAPNGLQNRIVECIDEQIKLRREGKDAYIGIKVNALADMKIIKKLIEASGAGVRIDLIVRGICCLVPGINDYTENIRVISIVGRYLEHSRVYIFGKGKEEKIYISSADLMTRNTVKRVEIAAPVYDEELKNKVKMMFAIMLTDNVKARELTADGTYRKVKNQEPERIKINSQELFRSNMKE